MKIEIEMFIILAFTVALYFIGKPMRDRFKANKEKAQKESEKYHLMQ
jgi:hypothetical protein